MFNDKELEDMRDKAIALEELLGSRGWAIVDYAFARMEDAAFAKMMNGPVPDVARHTASYCAIKEFRTWARRQRDFLAAQLNEHGVERTSRNTR